MPSTKPDSAILINVAIAGYGRLPSFEVQPHNCPTMEERIAYELLHHPTFRKAYTDEGMNPELAVGSVLRQIREREKAGRAKKEIDKLTRSNARSRRDSSRL